MEKPRWTDFMSFVAYLYTILYSINPNFVGWAYAFFISMFLFVLPGFHLLHLFSDHLRSDGVGPGVLLSLIPTLSIGYSLLVGLIAIALHQPPNIQQLALSVGLAHVLVFSLRRGRDFHLGKPIRSGLLAGVTLLMLPISQFVLMPFLTSPPSPFPYATGWDVFSYLMLAGLISTGNISTAFTTINPVTQQLPIPVGMPLLASYMFLPGVSHAASAVILAKFGAVIPSTLGLAWTYLICFRVTNKRLFAFTGAVISYSFTGYGVLDTKFFVPAGFAWAYSLFAVYVLLFTPPSRTGRILFLIGSTLALFFSFYTGVAVIITLALGTIGSIVMSRFSGTSQTLAKLYPLWALLVILTFALSGYSLNFSGAGVASTGLGAILQKITLMAESLTPLAWIVSIGTAAYFIMKYSSKDALLHILLISILIYFLPISAIYRLLLWPGVFAAIVTSKAASVVVAQFLNHRSSMFHLRPSLVSVIMACLLVSLAAYPSLIPPNYPPTVYISDGIHGNVQSSYSFAEYKAADFLVSNPPGPRYLILSDPGFSLILGGLTGQDAVRLEAPANVTPFQDQFRVLEYSSLNQSTLVRIVKLLHQSYQLTSYRGLIIAFSARTYYWVKHYGYVTYLPMDPGLVDASMRSNLLNSYALRHIENYQDVDLFYVSLTGLVV